ncbi:MAG: hypothetical protein WEG36_00680 [Gemmatimonadota bacterium]
MLTRRRVALAVAVLLAIVIASGCSELPGERLAQASDPLNPPSLVIFAFDRSSSILEHELAHAASLTRDRMRRLTHGDRFVALEILQLSLVEEPHRWAQQVPEREFPDRTMPRDSVTLARFLQDARDYVGIFTDPAGREEIRGTDILSTLHLVDEELAVNPGHLSTLVLYSDMLQANEIMNMEGLVRMPPADWVARQAAARTLPDLSGLCVVVVGAVDDNDRSQVVRRFWEEYFEATGAELREPNYGYRPVQIPVQPCPGM